MTNAVPEGPHLGDELSALLDRELSAEEEAAARAHLAMCDACSAELEGIGRVRAGLRALPPAQPPFGFLERLTPYEHAPRRQDRRASPVLNRRRRVGLAALAATAAASFGILLLSPPPDAPVSPQMTRLVQAHSAASSSGDPISQLAPMGVPVSFGR